MSNIYEDLSISVVVWLASLPGARFESSFVADAVVSNHIGGWDNFVRSGADSYKNFDV